MTVGASVEAKLFKKNWWQVLTRAWSSWAFIGIFIASILTAIEVALPVAWEFGFIESPYYPAFIGVAAMLGLLARLMVQKGIR